MKKLYFGLLVVLFLGLVSVSFMSDTLIDKLIRELANHKKENFQEKVYLHIDNPYYIAGEDVYYKGYLTNAYNNVSGGLSKVMYIELYDANNKLVSGHKSTIKSGFSSGNISLSDTLKTGNYSIVSYTNWMRNYDENYIFKKNITIYNTDDRSEIKNSISNEIDLQFFPEGGELVTGLVSKVAFKATNSKGVGIKVTAALYNKFGNKIADITSNDLGMGAFILKPNEGEEYHVQLKNTGIDKKYKLPLQLDQGLVMSVNNLGKEFVKVNVKKKGNSSENILIVVQSGGEIYYYIETRITSQGVVTKIPKNKLPLGICQITLFDINTEIPLLERSFFNGTVTPLHVNVTSDKHNYATREKVNTKIKVNDAEGLPVSGNFSLSISNREENMDSDNIYSYLLLTSELRGEIEKPNYYFQGNNPNAKRDLDYLMLTQGWTRFIWKSILDKKTNEHEFDLEMGGLFSIKNKIMSGGKPLGDKQISILLVNQLATYQSKTNADGILDYSILEYEGDESFIYQLLDNKNTDIEIYHSTNKIFQPFMDTKDFPDFSSDTIIKNSIQNHLINIAFNNTLLEKSRTKVKNIYSQNNYAVLYDKSIDLEDYVKFSNMPEIFKEIIPGVSLRKNKQGINEIKLFSKDSKINYALEPLYIVNGQPTFDTKYILELETSTVESIGIIHSPKNLVRFGKIGENGVLLINISEKISKSSTKTNDKNIFESFGYDIVKEFYQPKYENEDVKNNTIPDFRSVLYWNPNVSTDENGEATVEFYTSDELSNYHINIQGVSSKGQVGTLRQELFKVTFPINMK